MTAGSIPVSLCLLAMICYVLLRAWWAKGEGKR